MHSVTKYINGHADVTMGFLGTNNQAIYDKLFWLQKSKSLALLNVINKETILNFFKGLGAVPSPFECYLVLRGLKTLEIRMKKHMENAFKIAKWLESNPRIEKVLFPGIFYHKLLNYS